MHAQVLIPSFPKPIRMQAERILIGFIALICQPSLTKMLTLTKETYLLLEEYSSALKRIAGQLENDAAFRSLIASETKGSSTSAYTISEYVFFEIVSVFNLCAEPLTNMFDRFGIVFIGLKFYDPQFLTKQENIKALLREDNTELVNHYVNYSQRVRAYHSAISPDAVLLLVPKVLKVSNHPLFDDYGTALYRFASLIVKLDNELTGQEEQALKKIWQLTHQPVLDVEMEQQASDTTAEDDKETLEDVLRELDSLIGLSRVKQEVATLVNFIKIQQEREKAGLKTSRVSYHCVFTGAPGTGKTTVARIVARIFKKLGVLTKGHLVEIDRSGLIAEYAGQTAIKVDKAVQSALDGVLFIDEAYALIGENNDDYGREAVAALLKRMEDHRDKLVVIVAGYPNEMEDFINNNPGLKSRFNRYIHFEDYSAKELLDIYQSFCAGIEYHLSKEASAKLQKAFQRLLKEKDETFGNGRVARNIFEKTIERQANRLTLSTEPLTKERLICIEAEDIPDVNDLLAGG